MNIFLHQQGQGDQAAGSDSHPVGEVEPSDRRLKSSQRFHQGKNLHHHNRRHLHQMQISIWNTHMVWMLGSTGLLQKIRRWRVHLSLAKNWNCLKRTYCSVQQMNWISPCVCLWRKWGSLTGRNMLLIVYTTFVWVCIHITIKWLTIQI